MLAEVLNFQGAKPILGMGSLSYLYNPDEEGIRLATYNSGEVYIDKNRNGETGDDEYEEGESGLSLDEFYDYVDSLNLDDQEVINVEDIEFHDLTIKNIRDYLEK